MAVTNHERVGKGLELLRAGLEPFVQRELKRAVHAGGCGRVPPATDPERSWSAAAAVRLGRAGPAEGDVGHVERGVSRDPGPRPSAAWSASCANTATTGRTSRRSRATTRTVPSTLHIGC